jgi:hypothetical protein
MIRHFISFIDEDWDLTYGTEEDNYPVPVSMADWTELRHTLSINFTYKYQIAIL